jgi:hypothetical protein
LAFPGSAIDEYSPTGVLWLISANSLHQQNLTDHKEEKKGAREVRNTKEKKKEYNRTIQSTPDRLMDIVGVGVLHQGWVHNSITPSVAVISDLIYLPFLYSSSSHSRI